MCMAGALSLGEQEMHVVVAERRMCNFCWVRVLAVRHAGAHGFAL